MRLGLIGGTGKEGRGLAVRWALAGHEVSIGSRERARGLEKAAELSAEQGIAIRGGDNAEAIDGAQVVILCVPYGAHRATLEGLVEGLGGKVMVDITVPLAPPKVDRVRVPEGTSAAQEAQGLLGAGVKVVAALHHVSSAHLSDPRHAIDCDVLVCGDDEAARELVIGLIGDLGLRGLDAGVLCNAVALEALTPVLIHMNKRYKSKGTGIRITGL